MVKPTVPTPADIAWVKNDIDAFVLARLEEKHLTPAPPADASPSSVEPRSIHGLVPTPEEVQAFVSDTGCLPFRQ